MILLLYVRYGNILQIYFKLPKTSQEKPSYAHNLKPRAGRMNAAGVTSWQTTLFLWRDMWELGSGNKVKIPLSGTLQAAAFYRIDPMERRAVCKTARHLRASRRGRLNAMLSCYLSYHL
jgi:hypothetical protein